VDEAGAADATEPDAGNAADEAGAEDTAEDEADQVTTELDLRPAERPAAPE